MTPAVFQQTRFPPQENKDSSTAMVQFESVTKAYPGGRASLVKANLEIQRGEFVFVTGPSGSGKSTLMKLIYGQEQPDQGNIRVDGQEVGELRGDRLALFRRRLGIIFQDYKLLEQRTIAENVGFVLRAQGVPYSEIQQRLIPALTLVGLLEKADAFPHQLSGGEQQRASIARAIIASPSLVLADEPTGNLDRENALQVLKLLRQLHLCGITVMVTTHDLNLIKSTRFPVIQLQHGQLQRMSGLQP
jgi:cell division transport system ATP-binding protein